MLTVATVNVNGIRAAIRRGIRPWLDVRDPQVLCLQEVRAPDEALVEALGAGWHIVHEEATAKGRAGVAVASRLAPSAVRVGLVEGAAGRWVEADLPVDDVRSGATVLTVVSAYVPTGEAGTDRQSEKHRFLDLARERLEKLAADGRHVLACGDFNIAHKEADLKNWKGNVKKAGFLPAERAWLDDLLGSSGYVDIHRSIAGDVPGPYTWWSWRGQAFDTDAGWRIDYQFATPGLAALALSAEVDKAAQYAERWSDHAPLTVAFSFDLS